MTIGIVCALPEEVDGFLQQTSGTATAPAAGFLATRLGGFDVVIGDCGLGKVRAAIAATALAERWRCLGLVSAGTAGGLGDTAPMQVIVASELVQHDYGRSRGAGDLELYRPGVPPLPEYGGIDYALRVPADRLARFREHANRLGFVEYGRYASGDTFVNDDATRSKLESLGARAVDMEGAAVAQVAEHFGLPWLVAKGISDAASGSAHEDFLAGIAEASRRSAQVVEALLPALLDG
jgi:adenosylhomocysteine nucleosidase